jgi:large subunit ribosomal protein L25
MILFRDLVYSPEPAYVKLNIEGEEYSAILQDIQFHPVSEIILHADFLLLTDDKPIKMDIPVKFTGTSPGVVAGGKLVIKLRNVRIKALPANMPESITMDISGISLGKSIKVASIDTTNFEILNNPRVTIASVEVPRALKGAEGEDEEDEEEDGEEGGEGAAPDASEAAE